MNLIVARAEALTKGSTTERMLRNQPRKREQSHATFSWVVWLDHREAKIFEFNPDDVQKFVIHAQGEPARHIHHKAGSIGTGHAEEDGHYYHEVAEALAPLGEVLLVGPGQAKTALMKHLEEHDPKIATKVVGIETADHPTDGEVVASARKYFKAKDRELPQRSKS